MARPDAIGPLHAGLAYGSEHELGESFPDVPLERVKGDVRALAAASVESVEDAAVGAKLADAIEALVRRQDFRPDSEAQGKARTLQLEKSMRSLVCSPGLTVAPRVRCFFPSMLTRVRR